MFYSAPESELVLIKPRSGEILELEDPNSEVFEYAFEIAVHKNAEYAAGVLRGRLKEKKLTPQQKGGLQGFLHRAEFFAMPLNLGELVRGKITAFFEGVCQ